MKKKINTLIVTLFFGITLISCKGQESSKPNPSAHGGSEEIAKLEEIENPKVLLKGMGPFRLNLTTRASKKDDQEQIQKMLIAIVGERIALTDDLNAPELLIQFTSIGDDNVTYLSYDISIKDTLTIERGGKTWRIRPIIWSKENENLMSNLSASNQKAAKESEQFLIDFVKKVEELSKFISE